MKNNQNKKNRQPTAEEQFRKIAVLAAGICENRPWEHAGCPGPFVCYYDDGMETYIYILITDDAGNRGFRIYHTRRDYARSCTPYDTREKNLRKDIETVYDAVFFCDGENRRKRNRIPLNAFPFVSRMVAGSVLFPSAAAV